MKGLPWQILDLEKKVMQRDVYKYPVSFSLLKSRPGQIVSFLKYLVFFRAVFCICVIVIFHCIIVGFYES